LVGETEVGKTQIKLKGASTRVECEITRGWYR